MSILDDKDMWRRARARENAEELLAVLKGLVGVMHMPGRYQHAAYERAVALIARIEGDDE